MSSWPPDPNKSPDNSDNNQPPNQLPNQQNPEQIKQIPAQYSNGREWHMIEKTLMASVEEQRRARRWRIFFKFITLGYVLLFIFVMGKSCAPTDTSIRGIDVSSPHIAVIDVHGVISNEEYANAYVINEALADAFKSPKAKAVVLDINSPGGSPVQSDEIWQTMMDLRKEYPEKKLYAVIGDMGASGAYYIASAADEIYVNRSSLVGSIGVIISSYNVQGLLDKIGVKDNTLTAGEYKDILSMSRPLTEFEQQHVENVLDNTHKHFINAVKKGRGDKLKDPEGNKLFSGLFWTGERSVELGLADKLGGIRTVKKELDIDNLVNYTPVDPMEQFFESFAIKLGSGIGSTLDMKLLPEDKTTGEMR